jgi:hypothetical protein
MRDNTLQVKQGLQFYELTTKGNVKKWADVTATPIVGHTPRELSDQKNTHWRVEYCYNEHKPNPENGVEGLPQDLHRLKRFTETDWDPTKAQYRTLGLIEGDPHMARDINENFAIQSITGTPKDGFTVKLRYNLSKSYPVLGAVLSFDSSSDEKATYDATVDVGMHDGTQDVSDVYNLSWGKKSQSLANNDGYVNLYQSFGQSHNSDRVDFTLHGGPGVWEHVWGFSLVVEAES